MIPLKFNTIGQEIPLGYFVDSTDQNSEEIGLTIANTDIKLWKNGAVVLVDKDSGGATHIANGIYYITFNDTDTDTYGPMVVFVHVSGALAIRVECLVMNADAFDALYAADGTGHIEADMIQISGDAIAADNLELMYDTTGYIDATAPASRAQVAAISSVGGGALNFVASSDNILADIKSISFVGVQTLNTFAVTDVLDSVLHVIDDTTNEIDIVYCFNVGGARLADQMAFDGFVNSNNDTLNILAYDFVGAVWDTIGVIPGQNGSSNQLIVEPLLIRHTGTGVDAGLVYIRLQNTGQTNPTLSTDRFIVSAVSNTATIGYEGGAIWLDTNASNENTESFVDGTTDNPVSTIVAARTLADALNVKVIHAVPGSSYTLTQTFNNFEFIGAGFTVDLGSQDVSGCRFINAAVIGIGTGSTLIVMRDCVIPANSTFPRCVLLGCRIDGVLTLSGTGNHVFDQCFGDAFTIDFGDAVGNTNIVMTHFSGDLTVESMGDTGVDTMHMDGWGSITEGTCAGGAIHITGNITTTGITNIVVEEDGRVDLPAINAEVVDTLNVDTYSEPGQELPAPTTSLADKIGYIYKFLINRKNQTSVLWQLFNNAATTVDQKATVSSDGSTTEHGKIESGP